MNSRAVRTPVSYAGLSGADRSGHERAVVAHRCRRGPARGVRGRGPQIQKGPRPSSRSLARGMRGGHGCERACRSPAGAGWVGPPGRSWIRGQPVLFRREGLISSQLKGRHQLVAMGCTTSARASCWAPGAWTRPRRNACPLTDHDVRREWDQAGTGVAALLAGRLRCLGNGALHAVVQLGPQGEGGRSSRPKTTGWRGRHGTGQERRPAAGGLARIHQPRRTHQPSHSSSRNIWIGRMWGAPAVQPHDNFASCAVHHDG